MATAKRTQQPEPPKAGTRPSVRVDDQLAADLAVVMRTGANLSDAIRLAVRQVADMYRTAWAEGVVPVGTAPTLLAYQLHQDPTMTPPQPRPSDAVTSGYDARRTPPASPVGHPAAPVGHPSAPTPGRRRLFRRSGPIPGLPVRQP
ncbi:hypothetical protein SEA_PICARD_55 [Streptomyces phage Picard]|uniref:Ribbon-helix-helix DNA binding domain protein n=1 Tax=Streptomyces phage Picard TaxID=1920311 RepID=A0A1J0MC87_9CAUD|nr:hypothetical protein HOR45_gp55 [Streptomyces phage Picard]APD18584.1 hypothetical protein SEA_PICARD_55 [Streptomyces phage Picard]